MVKGKFQRSLKDRAHLSDRRCGLPRIGHPCLERSQVARVELV